MTDTPDCPHVRFAASLRRSLAAWADFPDVEPTPPPPDIDDPAPDGSLPRPADRVHDERPGGTRVKVGILGQVCVMGGAEEWSRTVAAAVDPERVRITGFAFERADRLTAVGESVASARRRQLEAYAPVSFGRDAVRRLAIASDVVLIWGIPRPERYLPAVGDPRRPKVVLTSHGDTRTDYTANVLVQDDLADAVVAVSRQALEPVSAGARPKSRVIYNAIDPVRTKATRGREDVRAEWGVGPGEKVLGFLGRLSLCDKNPCALSDAMPRLPSGWTAVFAGQGLDQDVVKAHAEKVAPGRCKFLGHRWDVADQLGGFDWLVSPSFTEGCALNLVEAMLCRVPILATPVGAVPEMEEIGGGLVRLIEPTGESIAVEALRDDEEPEAKSARVERAYRTANETFSFPHFGRAWTDFLLEIAER